MSYHSYTGSRRIANLPSPYFYYIGFYIESLKSSYIDWSFFVDEGDRRGTSGFQKLKKIREKQIFQK